MSAPSLAARGGPARRPVPLLALAIGAVALFGALWFGLLTWHSGDGGSLDARAYAVGATVRCPVCKEGIPLNDIANPYADQMRGRIRNELRQGLSEDQVRQGLVDSYGTSILLAPPQQGFGALAWFVPLLVVALCAVALLFLIRRWSLAPPAATGAYAQVSPAVTLPGSEGPWQGKDPEGSVPMSDEARRYEELLDRELRRRG